MIPWGNSDVQTAVDRALAPTGGDALVNVATSSSLYGFLPIYNVFSFTCTRVKGTAVKLDGSAAEAAKAESEPAKSPPHE